MLSKKDQAHVQLWQNDPQWVAAAKDFAGPEGGMVMWTITGGFRRWDGDGNPPTHVNSAGDLVPVVSIKF